jgi:hypothetical protein
VIRAPATLPDLNSYLSRGLSRVPQSGNLPVQHGVTTTETAFRSTTDMRRRAPPPAEDAESETSEWVLRERREREEERRAETEELGAVGAEVEEPLFLPTPAFMASAEAGCE